MIAFSVVTISIAIYNVKQDVKRGDSIQKRNEEWHRKHNEEYAKEQALKASQKS